MGYAVKQKILYAVSSGSHQHHHHCHHCNNNTNHHHHHTVSHRPYLHPTIEQDGIGGPGAIRVNMMCWFGKVYRARRSTINWELVAVVWLKGWKAWHGSKSKTVHVPFFFSKPSSMMTRLSDFRKCSGLLLLLLFLALDGITSPMQEKLFKEYGVSKSPDWQDWLSSLTSSNVFYFVHLWTSVRAQRVFYIMLHQCAECAEAGRYNQIMWVNLSSAIVSIITLLSSGLGVTQIRLPGMAWWWAVNARGPKVLVHWWQQLASAPNIQLYWVMRWRWVLRRIGLKMTWYNPVPACIYRKLQVQDVQTDSLLDCLILKTRTWQVSSQWFIYSWLDGNPFQAIPQPSWSSLNQRLKRLSPIQGKWRNLVQLCLLPQWTCGNCP